MEGRYTLVSMNFTILKHILFTAPLLFKRKSWQNWIDTHGRMHAPQMWMIWGSIAFLLSYSCNRLALPYLQEQGIPPYRFLSQFPATFLKIYILLNIPTGWSWVTQKWTRKDKTKKRNHWSPSLPLLTTLSCMDSKLQDTDEPMLPSSSDVFKRYKCFLTFCWSRFHIFYLQFIISVTTNSISDNI